MIKIYKLLKPSKRKIILLSIIIVLFSLLAIRFASGEDDWICVDGIWQKHGNPASYMPQGKCTNRNLFKKDSSSVPLPSTEDKINYALNSYPPENILTPEYNGKVFCSFHLYGYDEEKNMVYAYLWAYCEEYYKADNKIYMGSGVSMPIKVSFIPKNNTFKVKDYSHPQDGEGYPVSIKEMFPDKYEDEIIKGYDVSLFSPNPEQKAQDYF